MLSAIPSSVRRPRIATVSIAAALLCPALLGAQSERRTLSGSHVALYNVAGEVRIVRGSGRDVQVEITRRGRDAERLRVESGSTRGMPTLRVIYPDDDIVYRGGPERRWGGRTEANVRSDGTWGGDGWSGSRDSDRGRDRVRVKTSGSGVEAWADIRVSVPDGVALDSYLLVGELTATDVDADLRLDVGAARVSATDTRGALIIDAGSGGVELRRTRGRRLSVDNGSGGVTLTDVSSDDCDIDTGSGGVTASTISCSRFKVDVGSGGVRLSGLSSNEVSVESGSGTITMGLVKSPSQLVVETGSGGVTLDLPNDFGGDVDVDTGSGSISTDFAIRTNSVERRRLRGTIGNGASRVRVESGSGSVRLRRASM